jgi:hypothetical protein
MRGIQRAICMVIQVFRQPLSGRYCFVITVQEATRSVAFLAM